MAKMNITEQNALWKRLVNESFSSRPRLHSLLSNSEVIESERGCKVLLHVNEAQGNWLNDNCILNIQNLVNKAGSPYSNLSPLHISYRRGDGTIVDAEAHTPVKREQNPSSFAAEWERIRSTQRASMHSNPYNSPQVSRQTTSPRASEKILHFVESISSVKSGNKRYTSPALALIALPVFLVGWIVSIFDKK